MGFGRTGGRVGVGSRAPSFTLSSQRGEEVSLEGLLGRGPVVLYFYPRDDTPGCTKEACAFRDDWGRFEEFGAEVVGISSDPVESHRRFAEKHSLPFVLLSDKGRRVRRLYGVPATFGIFPGRATYVIDEKGIVRHVFSSQLGVSRHVEEALKGLRAITAGYGTWSL